MKTLGLMMISVGLAFAFGLVIYGFVSGIHSAVVPLGVAFNLSAVWLGLRWL